MIELQKLLILLHKHNEQVIRSDIFHWEMGNNKIFIVKSYEKLLVFSSDT